MKHLRGELLNSRKATIENAALAGTKCRSAEASQVAVGGVRQTEEEEHYKDLF